MLRTPAPLTSALGVMKRMNRVVAVTLLGGSLFLCGYYVGRYTDPNEARRATVVVSYLETSNYINRDLKLLRMVRDSNNEKFIKSLENWVSHRLPSYNDYHQWAGRDVDSVTREALINVLKYEADYPGSIDTNVPGLSLESIQHLAGGKAK